MRNSGLGATVTEVRFIRWEQILVTQNLQTLSTISILTKKRGNALRRAETTGKALDRLEGTKEYPNVVLRHKMYLQSVANLTLAIDAVRLAESREVKVFGSLGA